MSDDPLKPGGALSGRLFEGFLRRLANIRELEAGERVGPFRVHSEIGRGGSGVVYLAERADGAFSQKVALKWLRGDRPVPGGGAVLVRERELLASLDHPNIARLVDGGESDEGQLWFAMDFVEGEAIDRALARQSLVERIVRMRDLCRAVHHAHSRGLIHGDIKPANVLIDQRGQVRLLDFGIARLQGAALGGSYGLTPEFASPEQRRGEALTTASDVWQLGRLLQELAGSARIPADLRAVIDRAMAEPPEQRYSSAAALAGELEAWLAGRPVSAYGGLVYRLRRLAGRHQAVMAVVAIALATLIGAGLAANRQLAAERDRAQLAAAQAEAALAEAESALARSEQLREFMLGLFRAGRPDRPRDQLPSTADLLERGAQQALQPGSVPASERFGMLLAIGQVYQARGQYEQARPLIEEAVSLTRPRPDWMGGKEHARALVSMADLMIAGGDDLDQAEALLIEAESLLPAGRLEQLVPIRISRTWVDRHRGQHQRALGLVDSLAARWEAGEPLSLHRQATLFDALAGLHAAAGNLEQAARFSSLAVETLRQTQGEQSQAYVVSLSNSVGLQTALGNFAEAERRARYALELYDRIYPEPVDYRASVRIGLARIKLTTGRVEQAFAQLALAGDEQARFLGVEPERWPLSLSRRATFHARLGDLERALADMENAHALLHEHGGLGARLGDTMDMLLAWVLCLDGRGSKGSQLLADVDVRQSILGHPRTAAQWHEARAACGLALGQLDQALAAIEQALELTQAPGQVLDRFDRRLLQARILDAQDRPAQAQESLHQAREELLAIGLASHPALKRLNP